MDDVIATWVVVGVIGGWFENKVNNGGVVVVLDVDEEGAALGELDRVERLFVTLGVWEEEVKRLLHAQVDRNSVFKQLKVKHRRCDD